MLITDKNLIGKNLYKYRKKCGLTQFEVAEKAGLSDRTYADIERGQTIMRIDTLLKICDVLGITPNDILTEEDLDSTIDLDSLIKDIDSCSTNDKQFIIDTLKNFIKTR